jgi:DNA modification methylase
MAVKHQTIKNNYAIYCADCCEVLPDIPDESIDFCIFSPPFCNLYSYSDSKADMGNSKGYKEFFKHFDFLISELFRLILPGRVIAVHCMDMPIFKRDIGFIGLHDFPGDIIKSFCKHKFIFHSRHCIWKDPLLAFTRTHATGLAHKQIIKDSAMCRTGIPDYIVAFRKPGDNPKPIFHKHGFETYYGSREIPNELKSFLGHSHQETNKLSHWIWQQYASPVWFDIRQTRTLAFRQGKDKDDEKHICPLQLDTIERCMALWTTKNDTVLTPFMGIGSEVYVAIKNGRRAIGIELKYSYYKQALKNLAINEKIMHVKGLFK